MRRAFLFILAAALLAAPAAAQRIPVPDITRFAEYAPASAIAYAAIRADAGYQEQTAALLDRLEPLIGDASYGDFLDDIFNEPELSAFLGDGLAIAVLTTEADFDDLLGEGAPVTITFGVKDIGAATAFLTESLRQPMQTRNGWQVWEQDDEVRALLRDDVMIVSPDFAFTDQLISGDYGKLTNDAEFQATLARLPAASYDILAYGDLSAITTAGDGRAPGRMTGESRGAVRDLLGKWAVGAVNVGGRDLLIDVAWRYGDASGMEAFGFTPDTLIGPATDPGFAARVPASTVLYLQSANLGGMLEQLFDLMNVAGALLEGEPMIARSQAGGFVNGRMGETARAAVSFGLAATTGLNLQSDVIDALEGDFAFYLGADPGATANDAPTPAAGIVLAESGQGEAYTTALVSTLDRAGYPITRVPLRGADSVLDMSTLTDQFLTPLMPVGPRGFDAANNPKYDVWFGVGSGVMALGTAPSVQFALAPGPESLGAADGYQHAVESVFLPGAQALAFVNVAALARVPGTPDELTGLVESMSASAKADAEGVTGRFAVSLR